MTTYSYFGFTQTFREHSIYNAGTTTGFDPDFEFSVAFEPGDRFHYTMTDPTELLVQLDINGYSEFRAGGDPLDLGSPDVTQRVLFVEWQDGSETLRAHVLELEVITDHDGAWNFGTRYYMSLGGDPLPAMASIDDFNFFATEQIINDGQSDLFPPANSMSWASLAWTDRTSDDILTGTSNAEVFQTGDGDDVIHSSQGSDVYDGGDENGGGDELIFAADPNGVRVNVQTQRAIDGWGDFDSFTDIESVTGSMFSDILIGPAFSNPKASFFYPFTFRGLAGDDVFVGNDRNKVVDYSMDAEYGGLSGVIVDLEEGTAIDGFGDTDTLIGMLKVYGTEFDDTLTGSNFTYDGDVLRERDEVLFGQGGNDTILGLDGEDWLNGGFGADVIYGGNGNDQIEGSFGNDQLFGGIGHDTLSGDFGRDVLDGGRGNDTLYAGSSNNVLLGGPGSDRMYGGLGESIFDGGHGDDYLSGGNGPDTFVFSGRFGNDSIHGFDALDDDEKIDLSQVVSIRDFEDLQVNHMVQVENSSFASVLITTDEGHSITLNRVDIADLDAKDFIF